MPSLRVKQRQTEAEQRQTAYDALTTAEKYDRAVKRGHSKTREAERLRAAMKDESK